MSSLLFGTAGTPISAPERDSITGIETVRKLNLDAMELEFTYGVRMSRETAKETRKAAEDNNISLSVNAPYYINLNAQEKHKLGLSRHNILQSCRIGEEAGARIALFHPGFYMKRTPEATMQAVKKNLERVLEELEKECLDIRLGLETTGKKSVFGNLEETLKLSKEYKQVFPVIDFSHLHARGGGSLTNEKAFDEIIKQIPKKFLASLHMHASGMNYTEKGERNHLVFEDEGNTFSYKALLKSLKKNNVMGTIICESPNIEEDALRMKKFYFSKQA